MPVRDAYFDRRREYRAPETYAPTADDFAYCFQFVVTAALRLASAEAQLVAPAWVADTGNARCGPGRRSRRSGNEAWRSRWLRARRWKRRRVTPSWVRIPPPPLARRSPPGWWNLPYKQAVASSILARRTAPRAPAQLNGRASGPHPEGRGFDTLSGHGDCSSARSERRVVVSDAVGSNPTSHPKRARHRW